MRNNKRFNLQKGGKAKIANIELMAIDSAINKNHDIDIVILRDDSAVVVYKNEDSNFYCCSIRKNNNKNSTYKDEIKKSFNKREFFSMLKERCNYDIIDIIIKEKED